jgi:hypothetical protein
MSVKVERIREFKKLVESLSAEIALVDNHVLHEIKTRQIPIEERRNLVKLRKELKQMQEQEVDL